MTTPHERALEQAAIAFDDKSNYRSLEAAIAAYLAARTSDPGTECLEAKDAEIAALKARIEELKDAIRWAQDRGQ